MNDIHVLLSLKHEIGAVYENNELNGRKPIFAIKLCSIAAAIEMCSLTG